MNLQNLKPILAVWRIMLTRRSKRPGAATLHRRTSARLVAASTMTFWPCSKPSISTRIWFRVLLALVVAAAHTAAVCGPRHRFHPKMMQGAFFFGRQMSRRGGAPTNISTNSEPNAKRTAHFGFPGHRAGQHGLPVPGGPPKTPLGILAGRANFFGVLKKSTTSVKILLGLF